MPSWSAEDVYGNAINGAYTHGVQFTLSDPTDTGATFATASSFAAGTAPDRNLADLYLYAGEFRNRHALRQVHQGVNDAGDHSHRRGKSGGGYRGLLRHDHGHSWGGSRKSCS